MKEFTAVCPKIYSYTKTTIKELALDFPDLYKHDKNSVDKIINGE